MIYLDLLNFIPIFNKNYKIQIIPNYTQINMIKAKLILNQINCLHL